MFALRSSTMALIFAALTSASVVPRTGGAGLGGLTGGTGGGLLGGIKGDSGDPGNGNDDSTNDSSNPASGSGRSGSCQPNNLLCCSQETTDDLLNGVSGTLTSVLNGLLGGGPIDGCEQISSDTPCADQPLCCEIPVLQPGSTVLSLSCSPIDANL